MPLPKSIRHKLYYSKLQLKFLDSQIVTYLELPPDTVMTQRDEASQESRLVAGAGQGVPSIIRLLSGDILQNVRSVLDYLVSELVPSAQRETAKYITFPVCKCPHSFDETVRSRKLKRFLIPDVIAEIEALQPYHFGKGNEGESPLFVLNELTNIHKHRSILLARQRIAPVEHMRMVDQAGNFIGFDPRRAMDDEATTQFIADAVKMKMDTQLAIFVQFDEGPARGLEVISTLAKLMDAVGLEVLPKFEKFFA